MNIRIKRHSVYHTMNAIWNGQRQRLAAIICKQFTLCWVFTEQNPDRFWQFVSDWSQLFSYLWRWDGWDLISWPNINVSNNFTAQIPRLPRWMSSEFIFGRWITIDLRRKSFTVSRLPRLMNLLTDDVSFFSFKGKLKYLPDQSLLPRTVTKIYLFITW